MKLKLFGNYTWRIIMSSQNKQNKISGKNWVKKYFAKSVNATKGVKGANFYNG